jgi:hypothetical protein
LDNTPKDSKSYDRLRDAGLRGLGEFINVEPHYEIRVDTIRGNYLAIRRQVIPKNKYHSEKFNTQ